MRPFVLLWAWKALPLRNKALVGRMANSQEVRECREDERREPLFKRN
ncbi:hypothetical protein KCP70_08375 [Salmonella enterica subsp. enterica]|nr:hypothetical protein KCP70_08375 [Salmonella enterica subsp. enterica]